LLVGHQHCHPERSEGSLHIRAMSKVHRLLRFAQVENDKPEIAALPAHCSQNRRNHEIPELLIYSVPSRELFMLVLRPLC
jgi:hypothetical protein